MKAEFKLRGLIAVPTSGGQWKAVKFPSADAEPEIPTFSIGITRWVVAGGTGAVRHSMESSIQLSGRAWQDCDRPSFAACYSHFNLHQVGGLHFLGPIWSRLMFTHSGSTVRLGSMAHCTTHLTVGHHHVLALHRRNWIGIASDFKGSGCWLVTFLSFQVPGGGSGSPAVRSKDRWLG